jgi:hypothetical protein
LVCGGGNDIDYLRSPLGREPTLASVTTDACAMWLNRSLWGVVSDRYALIVPIRAEGVWRAKTGML